MPCGLDLDQQGHHAEVCEIGGGITGRHDRLRDWLAKWIDETTGRPAKTEQVVPHWARPRPDGSIEEARLDISFVDSSGR